MNYALLISGGVDSAVATHLLCEKGIRPDLFYIKIGMQGEDTGCTAEEDMELSQSVAKFGAFEQVAGHAYDRTVTRKRGSRAGYCTGAVLRYLRQRAQNLCGQRRDSSRKDLSHTP